MTLWPFFLAILVLPYLMFFTARAIHQDETIGEGARGWLAAGTVLFPPTILWYWGTRLRRRGSARR